MLPKGIKATRQEKAEKWLADSEGRKEMKKEILRNLLVNLQIEEEEGRNMGGDEEKAGRANARLSRKQYKEMAELALEISGQLERE